MDAPKPNPSFGYATYMARPRRSCGTPDRTRPSPSNGWPVVLASRKRLLETGRALAITSPQAMQRAKRDAVARATSDAR
jgi:hypothetical protein